MYFLPDVTLPPTRAARLAARKAQAVRAPSRLQLLALAFRAELLGRKPKPPSINASKEPPCTPPSRSS